MRFTQRILLLLLLTVFSFTAVAQDKPNLRAWIEPWTPQRVPLITNLRRDPYERAHVTSNTYYDWMIDRIYFLVPAQAYVGQFLATFQEFPPRQKPASFSIDQAMEKMQTAGGSK